MTTAEAAALLNTAPQNVTRWCQRHNVSRHGRDYWLTDEHIEQLKLSIGHKGRKKKEITMADPVKYIVVNAHNTDGYTVIREYNDGSRDSGSGHYQTIESAFDACDEQAQIVNGTSDWTNQEARDTFGLLFDA